MEFFMLIGLAFLATTIFLAASANEAKEFSSNKKLFLMRDVALKLQKEVTIASSVEEGYERNFDLPEKLDSFLNYSIITGNTTITVNSSNAFFSAAIPKITGNFTKGPNKIENIGGKIFVNAQK